MLSKEKKIAIVGLGLLGGSYAKGLSESAYKIIGIDTNLESIEYAKKLNWIIEGSNKPEIISEADIIIFALYPLDVIKWISQNQKYFKSGAIITDVTGVKVTLIKELDKILREDVEFIASHPMAGREVSGIKHSNTEMFQQANFIIVPTEKNSKASIEIVKNIAETLKFNNIVILNPQEHDEIVGFVSQLTHVIAVCLMNTKDNEHLVDYTGDSFRDLTRIAKINENLWTELFLMNKEVLIKEIDLFSEAIKNFREVLVNENTDRMKELFKESTKRRKKFDKK